MGLGPANHMKNMGICLFIIQHIFMQELLGLSVLLITTWQRLKIQPKRIPF